MGRGRWRCRKQCWCKCHCQWHDEKAQGKDDEEKGEEEEESESESEQSRSDIYITPNAELDEAHDDEVGHRDRAPPAQLPFFTAACNRRQAGLPVEQASAPP